MREDLRVSEQWQRGERVFVLGDPLGLEYFHLNEQEYFLLQHFDGRHSADDIKNAFDSRFAPFRIEYSEIEQYLIDFHRKQLLRTSQSDMGKRLYRARESESARRWRKSWGSPLAIRFRGLNPDRFFQWLTPATAWLFGRWIVAINLTIMLAASLCLATFYDEFTTRLPAMEQFFAGPNIVLLMTTMVLMKVVHECAHGVLYHRLGGRCHELGVMLLVFLPTLYVNTSDSWRLRSKYHRAGIAAAGIYADLCMAAYATFGWWFSAPGLIQYLCLNIMFLGAVSTLLFNGNPLLKFDGYYALSDLIEIPNLQSRSREYIRSLVSRVCFGVRGESHEPSSTAMRITLFSYATLSFAYRVFIVYFICFVIVRTFSPFGLREPARLFAGVVLTMLFFGPVLAMVRTLFLPGNRYRLRIPAILGTGIVLALVVGAACLVPLPATVVCDFVVQPRQVATVYVEYPATLEAVHVEPRQWVRRGQKLATLRNLDIELEIATLQGEIDELRREQKLNRLVRLGAQDDGAALQILAEKLETAERKLNAMRELEESMVLYAPQDGHVLESWKPAQPSTIREDRLTSWHGSPLDAHNSNALLDRGEPLCRVGNLDDCQALLIIDQSDIELVQEGQRVFLRLDSGSGKIIHGRIEGIATRDADRIKAPFTTEHGGAIEIRPDTAADDDPQERQLAKPARAVYEASVPLPSESLMATGLRGSAKISVAEQTIAQRLLRFLHKTFRLQL